VALIAATAFSFLLTGCQTLSSVGLPVSSNTYRLSTTARSISQSHTRAAALPRELSEDVLPVYIVAPGDVLYLEAAKFDSPMRLPGDQPVQPDGSIELGKYGRLQVAGMTIPQIRDEVQAAIDAREEMDWLQRAAERTRPANQDEEKQRAIEERDWREAREVVVRLVDWKSKVFYVMGEVNSPGAYPFTGSDNVLDALVAAGDITQRSDRHHIILSRPTGPCNKRIVLPICYDNLVQLGDSSSNYQIMPGDRIFVPSISLCDDLVQSFVPSANERCPRCGPPQRGESIPKVDCSSAICRTCQ
jgi:polysaccharide export outer membrane protein